MTTGLREIKKVLIANRGEIAVRIVHACRDEGIQSVAVFAEADRAAPFATLADEAYSLGGASAAETYLDQGKLIRAAIGAGADAVHPGYGFLAENSEFAAAVIDAGLAWIGPPPEAIEALGNKVLARRIAERVGAPLAAGTPGPVSSVEEVEAFVAQHGLPVAIKAAYGGGGRGLKVVRDASDLRDSYDSAVREAVAAFGRGECFVEKFLERPRHVETQCLADAHGNVVVISTRDCSMQRRYQKLIEEAPAPFLSKAQNNELYAASKAILTEAGYIGAGTCEFLIAADGTMSFLEVNTRLQVEHPVSEEVTGIDLVREQFRIARGEPLGYRDPEPRGHSIEFRINCEDPAIGFMPASGTVTRFSPPSGPGVRLDTGVSQGDVISGNFDSLIAKLVITGSDRHQAVARARRALREFVVEGVPTVLPFHRAVLETPAFSGEGDVAFGIHTGWIESEFRNTLDPFVAPPVNEAVLAADTLIIEVNGKRVEVRMPADFLDRSPGGRSLKPARGHRKSAPDKIALLSPMQGTVVKVEVGDGDVVTAGDPIIVIEAMKMEQAIKAHTSGVVSGLVRLGATVEAGTPVCVID